MDSFQYLQSELEKIRDYQTERSFYPILKQFLINFSKEDLKLKNEVNVISEASSKVHESAVGFPDLTVQIKSHDYQTIGWVEVKLPKDNIADPKFKEQFDRYTDSLENVLFTNLREWSLYQWDDKGKPKKVAECLYDAYHSESDTKPFINLLTRFFEGKTLELKTPKQLALALARKTRLLSQQIQETLKEAEENQDNGSDLIKLRDAFAKTLIQDLQDHQFANMAAETIAYSFFLAALEHQKRGKDEPLTLTTAVDYLPKSVPVLTDLYELIGKTAKNNESIKLTVDSLVEQFQKADMEKIHAALSKHEMGHDPVIHFYEPFLAEYDPKEREARGVYYTPKPVVDYIVKSVDYLLKEKFGKIGGIDDPDVYLLDPATGTGTFLMSAIELIYQKKQKQFGAIGDSVVRKEFVRVVQHHILKHFFGFELMIAPYAIAHLKLTMLLEDYGFNFDSTKDNGDDDDDRLKIYLANTLDEPHKEDGELQTSIFSFHKAISEETRMASDVKLNKPIMAIIGNPPYSGISSNMGEWIVNLLKKGYQRKDGTTDEGYYMVDGKPLGEKKLWLQDDYVKFIRFAQWKIDQMDEGVIGFITNNAFLDNPTFRGMRQSLMRTFSEIYILNLHGNSVKKEKTPEGGKDENVFNIQAGVSINLFVKTKTRKLAQVFHADLSGLKAIKTEYLQNNTCQTTQWNELKPKSPYYFFVPKDVEHDEEYLKFLKVTDIFGKNVSGIVTARDSFVIDFDKNSLKNRIEIFCNSELTDDEIRKRFFGVGKSGKYLSGDSRGWKLSETRKFLKDENHDENIRKIDYRPFDARHIYYHPKMVDWGREELMKSMQGNNVALITNKREEQDIPWAHCFISQNLIEHCLTSIKTTDYVFPLFLYENEKISNLNDHFILEVAKETNKAFVPVDQTLQIFDYIYGVLYLPKYRQKYVEQLKIDFPRIPLPSQVIESGLIQCKDPKEVFEKVSQFGSQLRQLHLLTHPIFEDSNQWGVQVAGNKPENLEDWKVTQVKYVPAERRVYVNEGQYFEGIDPEVWNYHIGGYQVLDKWLKDRKKAERCLDSQDLIQYCKIVVSLRETIWIVKNFE